MNLLGYAQEEKVVEEPKPTPKLSGSGNTLLDFSEDDELKKYLYESNWYNLIAGLDYGFETDDMKVMKTKRKVWVERKLKPTKRKAKPELRFVVNVEDIFEEDSEWNNFWGEDFKKLDEAIGFFEYLKSWCELFIKYPDICCDGRYFWKFTTDKNGKPIFLKRYVALLEGKWY